MLYSWDFIWHACNKLANKEWKFTFHCHYLTSLSNWLCMISTIATGHMGHSTTDLSILRGIGVQRRLRRAPLS